MIVVRLCEGKQVVTVLLVVTACGGGGGGGESSLHEGVTYNHRQQGAL